MKRIISMMVFVAVMVLVTGCAVLAEPTISIRPNNSSLVYQPGEAVSFTVGVNRVDVGADADSQFSWKVTDVNGKGLLSGKSAVTGPAEVRVPMKKLGWFKFSVVAVRDGAEIAAGNTTFAIIPRPPAVSNNVNHFGVNFHLMRVPLDVAEKECVAARRIGIGWGRGMLPGWSDVRRVGAPANWKEWDPAKTADKGYEWETWDPLADLVRKSGIEPLGATYYMPRWGSGAPQDAPVDIWHLTMPDDTTEFTKFCEQMAARYKDFVQYWEVGNEVDAGNFWKGRYANLIKGNDEGVIRDYVDYLAAARRGFLKGNPESQIVFAGTTGALPVGDTWQPFLETAMAAGAGWEFEIMNTHYMADLAGIKKIIRDSGVRDRPIWMTEIGRWSTPRSELSGHRWQVVQDITTIVMQQAAGAVKFFKYNIRDNEVSQYSEDSNFGLLYTDFSPKPNYAAYATLIRYFAKAYFEKELNVVTHSDHGWLRGYAYNAPQSDPRARNIFWLNDAKSARVSLLSPDKSVTMVDIMGNATKVPVVKGKAIFQVSELPFIVLGKVTDKPGKPEYPAPKVIRTIEIKLNNPGFEETADEAGTVPGWRVALDSGKVGEHAFVDKGVSHSGKQSVCIRSDEQLETWRMVGQAVVVEEIAPKVGPNEYVTFSCEGWLKYEGVVGRGAGFNCAFHDEKGERTTWMDTPYKPGTSDWKLKGFKDVKIPAGTKTIQIQPVLGPGSGKVWFDDAKFTVKVWRLPNVR